MQKGTDYPVDVVIPWVDQNDPAWRKEMLEWAQKEGNTSVSDHSEERFRDWDTVRFLLRGIDRYMPWVRTVHFVTCGHVPEWMNTQAPKLHLVKHSDYIPQEYLPTFSSHCIELNFHRIPDLAEHFVYFNDDILVLRPMKKEDLFHNGLPCDFGILNAFISSHRDSNMDSVLSDVEIINDHFSKNKMIKSNLGKWFNIKYGKEIFKTILLLPWGRVSNFYCRHTGNAYTKNTFQTVWKEEASALELASSHRFRTRRDVNQGLMRYWQIASGQFHPISPKGRKYYVLGKNNEDIFRTLDKKNTTMICINDVAGETTGDYTATKKLLLEHLERAFPGKSPFEK